jgi:hypothetical protein
MRYTTDTQRWEYMTFDLVKRKNEIEELNRLGAEGWEAVAMVSSWGVGWRFVHPIVLFKRPRPNEAEGSPGSARRQPENKPQHPDVTAQTPRL